MFNICSYVIKIPDVERNITSISSFHFCYMEGNGKHVNKKQCRTEIEISIIACKDGNIVDVANLTSLLFCS